MISAKEGKLVSLEKLAATTTATHAISFDTLGHDFLTIDIACGSHNSATQGITSIAISESDTVTSASSQTVIASLSSATATSTSASNVLPVAATMALGGIVNDLQIDLRKRARYIGAVITTGAIAAGMPVSVQAKLTRSKESADSAAEKSGINLAETTVKGCMAVIEG